MAAPTTAENRSLKEMLFESLTATLSPEHVIRVQGEEQIKVLEVTEEFGIFLAEFIVNPEVALAVRQMAAIILKQYVQTHWSQLSDKFKPPETPEASKAVIRHLLPRGLGETMSKVRSSVAYVISAIATWDWPEAWPSLFSELMTALTSGDPNSVHGAMRVLTEFTREVTDTQMPHVAPLILPEMYSVFSQPDMYGIRTRARAVEIFETCAGVIYSINELMKGIAKELLFPILPKFVEALCSALQVPDGLTSDSGLKKEIIKALTTLVKHFPRQARDWMPQVLPIIWTELTTSANLYIKTEVNDIEEADNPVDSDGEVLGFDSLIFSILEFVHALIETPKFRGTVKKSLDQLMYYIILYMQITEEQVRSWSENPEAFVADEDEDTFSFSVRISVQDLLLSLASEFHTQCAVGIVNAVTRHLHEAEAAKNSGSTNWWKIHEACFLAMGSVKSLILENIASNKISFDLHTFLTSVVLHDLDTAVSPFLLGRALWTSGRYVQVMAPELAQRFVVATISGLAPQQPSSIRISAVRATYSFVEHLTTSSKKEVILKYLASLTDNLLMVPLQINGVEVLALVMETIKLILKVDKTFTIQYEPKITAINLDIFMKHFSDPLLEELTLDIFHELAMIQECHASMQPRLLPVLLNIISIPDDQILATLQSMAMDIMGYLVRYSTTPLSDTLMQQVFPLMVKMALNTDDNSKMQSGGECVRAYLSVSIDQVMQYRDENGNTGMKYIMELISKLLDPRTSEYGAIFIEKLVKTLIGSLGPAGLGDNLDMILRAVLSKLQVAETLTVVQSLVMVFAHLMHTQLEEVLNFLSGVPGPTGKPALEFVLTEWCSRQHLFYGSYERKVSSTALSKLLQYVINTNDYRVQEITVKGEQIFSEGEGIRTRSKSSQLPERWTMIPLHVKIYKLLINELAHATEVNMSRQASAAREDFEEEESYDEDEDEIILDDSEDLGLATADYFGYGEEPDDDPDVLNDPINQIDLQAYLTEFLQQLSQQPCYNVFSQHLNELEKQALSRVGQHLLQPGT